MKKIDEYIQSRAQDLDLERGNTLVAIQEQLNQIYPGKVRAKRYKDGELTITTPSAAIASDLRLQQTKIMTRLKEHQVVKMRIVIT